MTRNGTWITFRDPFHTATGTIGDKTSCNYTWPHRNPSCGSQSGSLVFGFYDLVPCLWLPKMTFGYGNCKPSRTHEWNHDLQNFESTQLHNQCLQIPYMEKMKHISAYKTSNSTKITRIDCQNACKYCKNLNLSIFPHFTTLLDLKQELGSSYNIMNIT